jgi:hypothetical protein
VGLVALIGVLTFTIKRISPVKKVVLLLLILTITFYFQMITSIQGITLFVVGILLVAFAVFMTFDGRAVAAFLGTQAAKVNPARQAAVSMINRLDLEKIGEKKRKELKRDRAKQEEWERKNMHKVDRRSLKQIIKDEGMDEALKIIQRRDDMTKTERTRYDTAKQNAEIYEQGDLEIEDLD